jgi:hypothetical protein
LKAIGVFALAFGGLWLFAILYVIWGERDSVNKGRFARAHADMSVIEYTMKLYAMKYGHFPSQLADLVPGKDHSPGDACFLPTVPSSP